MATKTKFRMQTQIDDYTMKKGILSEVAYNQDMVTSLGDKFFELSLRNRHEE